MKKCNDCNTIMIEDTNLHTNFVGGVSFNEQIYLTYENEKNETKPLLSINKLSTKKVKARICPNCGKLEFYVDVKENN